MLRGCAPAIQKKPGRRLAIRRIYLPYYIVTLAFGCQKRIRNAALSTGFSLDHIVAIAASAALGVIWTVFGAQYVFYVSAASALAQIAVGCALQEHAGA